MHRPWAGSNKNHSFGAQYRSRLGRPSQSIHPHYLSVYASESLLPGHAATLDTGPVASGYPDGIRTRSSSNYFQSARASVGSSVLERRTSDHRPNLMDESVPAVPYRIQSDESWTQRKSRPKKTKDDENDAEGTEAYALASLRRNDGRQSPKTRTPVSFVFSRFFRLSIVGAKPQVVSFARAHTKSHCLNQRMICRAKD